ncbi:MAG: anti-sigma factor family protein [Acidobacteriota bacterium]
MSCSPFDLKDYFFGELSAPERDAISAHLQGCAACREELDRIQLTGVSLRAAVVDEEPPRRIAFVSDNVFKPRWWHSLWNSAPRLGFASAAMLAAAIVVHGFAVRPAQQPAATPVDAAAVEARVNAEVARRVDTAVRAAVAESEARQAKKAGEMVEAVRRDLEFQRSADRVAFQEVLTVMQKKYNVLLVASNELGGR